MSSLNTLCLYLACRRDEDSVLGVTTTTGKSDRMSSISVDELPFRCSYDLLIFWIEGRGGSVVSKCLRDAACEFIATGAAKIGPLLLPPDEAQQGGTKTKSYSFARIKTIPLLDYHADQDHYFRRVAQAAALSNFLDLPLRNAGRTLPRVRVVAFPPGGSSEDGGRSSQDLAVFWDFVEWLRCELLPAVTRIRSSEKGLDRGADGDGRPAAAHDELDPSEDADTQTRQLLSRRLAACRRCSENFPSDATVWQHFLEEGKRAAHRDRLKKSASSLNQQMLEQPYFFLDHAKTSLFTDAKLRTVLRLCSAPRVIRNLQSGKLAYVTPVGYSGGCGGRVDGDSTLSVELHAGPSGGTSRNARFEAMRRNAEELAANRQPLRPTREQLSHVPWAMKQCDRLEEEKRLAARGPPSTAPDWVYEITGAPRPPQPLAGGSSVRRGPVRGTGVDRVEEEDEATTGSRFLVCLDFPDGYPTRVRVLVGAEEAATQIATNSSADVEAREKIAFLAEKNRLLKMINVEDDEDVEEAADHGKEKDADSSQNRTPDPAVPVASNKVDEVVVLEKEMEITQGQGQDSKGILAGGRDLPADPFAREGLHLHAPKRRSSMDATIMGIISQLERKGVQQSRKNEDDVRMRTSGTRGARADTDPFELKAPARDHKNPTYLPSPPEMQRSLRKREEQKALKQSQLEVLKRRTKSPRNHCHSSATQEIVGGEQTLALTQRRGAGDDTETESVQQHVYPTRTATYFLEMPFYASVAQHPAVRLLFVGGECVQVRVCADNILAREFDRTRHLHPGRTEWILHEVYGVEQMGSQEPSTTSMCRRSYEKDDIDEQECGAPTRTDTQAASWSLSERIRELRARVRESQLVPDVVAEARCWIWVADLVWVPVRDLHPTFKEWRLVKLQTQPILARLFEEDNVQAEDVNPGRTEGQHDAGASSLLRSFVTDFLPRMVL